MAVSTVKMEVDWSSGSSGDGPGGLPPLLEPPAEADSGWQPPTAQPGWQPKRQKPIPPPLDLRLPPSLALSTPPRTAIPVISPSSPYHQKNLPFRKRSFSYSNLAAEEQVPDAGSPCMLATPQPSPLLSPRPLVRVDVPSRSVPSTPHLAQLQTPSALLSPAASHLSSSAGSSQEELRRPPHTSERFLFPPPGAPVSPHAWHASVWHTFMTGTRISFHVTEPYWVPVEEVARRDGSAAPYGLQVKAIHTDVAGVEPERCTLHLQAVYTAQPDFLAACMVQQPFFVQNHGWSSLSPEQTFEQYSVPCRELRLGDICLITSGPLLSPRPAPLLPLSVAHTPPGSPAGVLSRPAVLARPAAPPPPSPAAAAPVAVVPVNAVSSAADKAAKPKRPMNGFMLFAKKFRVELINQHPGKDNRAISVMLGERWKTLPPHERDYFTQEARVMAEEKKRLYPDCWKRKRSVSAS